MFSTLRSECVASNVAHCPVVCNSSTLSVRTNWQTQAVVSSVQIFLACTWLSGKTGWKGQGEGFFSPPMIVIENSTGTQRTNQQPFRLPPSRINGFYKTFPRTARKIKHSNVDSLTETFCSVHVFQLCVLVFIFVYLYVLSVHFGSEPWKAELRTTKHKSVQRNDSELKWLCESSSTSVGLVNQLLFVEVFCRNFFFDSTINSQLSLLEFDTRPANRQHFGWNMWQKTAPACRFCFFLPSSLFLDLLKHVGPSLTPIDSAWHLDATWDSKHMLQSTIPRKAVRSTHMDRRRSHLCGLTWKKTLIRERRRLLLLLCF